LLLDINQTIKHVFHAKKHEKEAKRRNSKEEAPSSVSEHMGMVLHF
jgi:hypothetical protein